MTSAPRFQQIVFSGGGTRCFWQGGFMDTVRDPLDLHPDRIASVSGGALTAAGFIARRGQHILHHTMELFSRLDSNIDPEDLVDDAPGLSPHQEVYREMVTAALDAEALKAICEGPEFYVLLGHPPRDSHSRALASAMTFAYEAELHLVGSPHFDWAEKLGLETSFVDARQAARNGRLIDLICAAATIPPVFDLAEWEGRPVIDGGMADMAPMPPMAEGRTLILLTRQYDAIPEVENRVYLCPTEETPADKIDFTDPDKIAATWGCGVRDGRTFLNQYTQD